MSTGIKKIIFNADDLGFSPAVNLAVTEAAKRGLLSSASVMSNMPFYESAIELVRENSPGISLGLHFCITSGRAVSPPDAIPLLVDENGVFRPGFAGLMRVLHSKKRPEALRQIDRELAAQISRTEIDGLKFDHIDSHQHVHALPGIFELLQAQAEKRNLVLRIPRERFAGRLGRIFHWLPGGILKRAILNYNLGKHEAKVGYFGILDTGKMCEKAIAGIFEAISRDNSGIETFEINIHPSHNAGSADRTKWVCSPGDLDFHLSRWREREFEALLSESLKEAVKKHNFELAGFA